MRIMNYTIGLQKYQDIRYNRLYLADINDLFVCNLDDNISSDARLLRFWISQDLRKTFYMEAVGQSR